MNMNNYKNKFASCTVWLIPFFHGQVVPPTAGRKHSLQNAEKPQLSNLEKRISARLVPSQAHTRALMHLSNSTFKRHMRFQSCTNQNDLTSWVFWTFMKWNRHQICGCFFLIFIGTITCKIRRMIIIYITFIKKILFTLLSEYTRNYKKSERGGWLIRIRSCKITRFCKASDCCHVAVEKCWVQCNKNIV